MRSAAAREQASGRGARPEATKRRADPALAANLDEIVLQCFEAGGLRDARSAVGRPAV